MALTFDTDGEFWTPLLHDRKSGTAIKSFHSSLFQIFYGVFLLRRKRKIRRAQGSADFFAAIEDSKTLISSVNDAIDDCLKRRLYCAKIKVFVHVGVWLRKLAAAVAAALTHIVLKNVILF